MKQLKQLIFKGNLHKVIFGIGKGLRIFLNPENECSKIIGYYEYEIQKHFKKFAKQSNMFLDIGAYDAYYSLIFRKHNKNAPIFCCEAGTGILERQIDNIKINKFDTTNFNQINKYIGTNESHNQTKVDCLIENTKNKTIFMKIDVEGAELDVIKGAVNTLNNNNCLLIIETHNTTRNRLHQFS